MAEPHFKSWFLCPLLNTTNTQQSTLAKADPKALRPRCGPWEVNDRN